jgi:hypothetical protein
MVVTLTDQPATLAGTVEDDRRRPLGDYTVDVFPADRARWASGTRSVRAVRPDQNGRFEVKGLPAGEYRAVAVDYLEPGAEADPDRLEKWATIATRVTLADGESKSITIMLIR